MTTSIRSDVGSSKILVDGIERVTVDSTGISVGAGRRLAQVQTYKTGVLATGTNPIPVDATIPQITEGTQFLSVVITPTNVNSLLEIDVALPSANSGISYIVAALFMDSISNALALDSAVIHTAGDNATLYIKLDMVAGTLAPITFKVRGGSSVGTFSICPNVVGAAAFASITVKEYLP